MSISSVPDLTISIISADNLTLLLPCLRSIFENTKRISFEVYVVDNASTDNTFHIVSNAFPGVKVICNTQRLGFSSNNNAVLSKGAGRYLMLLNDDTLILEGALDQMVEFMDEHVEVGAVGSFLLNPDGSHQSAFARFPHPIIEGVFPTAIWSHWFVREKMPFAVDSVCGATMMVRRQVLEQVGGLDTAFDPIYSEEIDWCYRIKKAGWKIYTLPEVKIIHYGSQTMNRIVPQKYELLLSHKFLFFRKHKGAIATAAYRLTLGLSTFTKFLWWSLISFFKSETKARDKRDLHWYLLKRIPSM